MIWKMTLMRDPVNKGGNVVTVKDAAQLKNRLGHEPGNAKRGVGVKLYDRRVNNADELNVREHARYLEDIERLRNKRLIRGPKNESKPQQTDFEREVAIYLRRHAIAETKSQRTDFEREVAIYLQRHALAEIMSRKRPPLPRVVEERYRGKKT